LLAALGAGVRGLLPRGAPVAEIVAAIEAAAAGLTVVHPDLLALLFSPESKEIPQPAEFEQALTPRETEILNMMAEGLGNKQIAWSLKISEHTVKFHISSIFAKLHVSSRTEAVTSGIRQGLIVI
jgi:NarL family two-component system response regulator YdfI